MANNLNANPMVITGDVATSYKAQVAATLGTLFTLKVEKLVWINVPANATISIGDPISGLILWNRKNDSGSAVDIVEDWTANPKLWQDFEINAFPGGTLYIYTR